MHLNLPLDDFLVDLFALGIESSNILQQESKFTAQQIWPFVVSAYSTQGTPRPCWFLIKECDELEKLVSFLRRAKTIGNGYYTRRVDTLISCIEAYISGNSVRFQFNRKDKIFEETKIYKKCLIEKPRENPVTPQFIRKNPLSEQTAEIVGDYISNKINAGDAVEMILGKGSLQKSDKNVVVALMRMCNNIDQRNGLVAVLRSEDLINYHSLARKEMFFLDFNNYGPAVE